MPSRRWALSKDLRSVSELTRWGVSEGAVSGRGNSGGEMGSCLQARLKMNKELSVAGAERGALRSDGPWALLGENCRVTAAC